MPSGTTDREALRERFNESAAIPLLLLAVALIPILLLPVIIDLPPSIDATLAAIGWFIWAAFAVELAVNVYLTEHRTRYLLTHWFDVALVALPFLRPLRIVRSARLLRLFGVVRVLAAGARLAHTLREILTMHSLHYLLTVALILTVAAAAAHFERDAGGTIQDFPDALWWAVTTVTTVGYGDTYPVTGEGRGVGVFLMLVGIGVFGTLTASVAAFFVASAERESTVTIDDLMAEIRRLHDRLDEALTTRDPAE